jgi:hypothetical protein
MCLLFPVLDRSAAILLLLIRDNCITWTTMISDCWAAYNVQSQDQTLEHRQVNHITILYLLMTPWYTHKTSKIAVSIQKKL